jgi:hypothetical protein
LVFGIADRIADGAGVELFVIEVEGFDDNGFDQALGIGLIKD